MPYDEQGNFYGSDEDLGALEAKYTKPDLASQIPGQVSSSKSDEPKSLRERAVSALTQANPLMMGKSLQDMTRTLVGGSVLPVVAPVSAGIQALNALPGNLLRRSRGEEEVKTPSTEELMQKYGEIIAPKTQMGRDFEQGLSKAMDVAKVPHAWSMSPQAPRRPVLTPTDVRVGAGQVKQLAKELRETPADFQAAQSGLKRQNLYGEDTIGVKAQAAADALGDTIERRKSAGLSTIPGVPQALTPDNKMYAVRPKGTRMIQPKVPKSAGAYRPDISPLEGIVEDVYGDTPAAQMPPEMVSAEYAKRFLTPDSELSGAFKNYRTLRVQEMFPDAPTPRAAQNAYDLLYADRSERTKQQMVELEEFLNFPENAAYRESAPTPTEFMQRMAEAERVIKGPFSTYLSKNVGAEGDPTVKLARQGITIETPETIQQLANFASPTDLAKKRVEAGFPAMGTFYGERLEKTSQLDRLNEEIEALEQARQPLFDRAHEEGIDPASIPEYAETTNPLRQKLRQKEQLEGEIENIKLAQDVESITDSAIEPKTKQEMLERIPFEQRQFYPGVTKAGEGEKLYMGRESLLKDLGFKKLGKELVEDILTGKAGDTSKLTIENYMREKGLSRIEAEKAAKLQEQKYRETLQNSLLDRIKNDQNVKMIGNAAIITLDQNTPRDVAMRDMSADTAVLDHCVGQCGTAPQGRKNILSGKQQYYEPVIDPITGERSSRASGDTSYVRDLEDGAELVSVRDIKTGLPAATIQLMPNRDGTFRIGYASGAKNGAVDAAYTPAIRDYLNQRSSVIRDTGSNLADNTGIFDINNAGEFKRAIREAGVNKDLAKALELNNDLPRFVTVDDIKAAAKGATSTEVAVVEPQRRAEATGAQMPELSADELLAGYGEQMTRDQREWLTDFSRRWEEDMDRFQDTGFTAQDRLQAEYDQWLAENRLQPDPLANLFDDLEPDPTAVANQGAGLPLAAQDVHDLAGRYDVPPAMIRNIIAEVNGPVERAFELQNEAFTGAGRFATLQEASRSGAVQLIGDLLNERAQNIRNERQQGFVAAPLADELYFMDVDEQGVANVQSIENTIYALRNGVIDHRAFRELPENRRQAAMDLVADMVQARLADHAAVEPPAPRQALQMAQRDPVPRNLQTMAIGNLINDMSPEWNRRAQELADTYFNDNIIDGPNISIGSLTGMLRDYRIGPHAEAPAEVRELAARRLESLHTEAEGSAEQIADALNEAFYMDMDPQEAIDQISRDISMMERDGENSWEDLVGPMAEDIPWNRNLQHHLLGYLRALMENYGNMREEGYAKGGMVKKKRKAKKPTMPLVVTRKNPELAEMAYQYGGMVR
jgi:hypothetical protein